MLLFLYNSQQRHLFHIIPGSSPWPFITSITLLSTILRAITWIYHITSYNIFFKFIFILSFLVLILSMCGWWNDVVREGRFEGRHTSAVQRGLRVGMVLFILSEVMFFFAFFWAYFHARLAPTIEIGCIWPPQGITVFDPWSIPFLNTYILLLSGVTITYCHHNIIRGNYSSALNGFIYTILLALLFTALQAYEYINAPFSINDRIYGRTFYMATGFHGLHVIIGTIFITVCSIRLVLGHFTKQHHFGFEAAAWYWHFVDVVWLFLYISIYWWGSSM